MRRTGAWLGACGVVLTACAPTAADPTLDYVGGASCSPCHAEVVAAWSGSDHDRSMDHATPETVLGDFRDVTLVRADGETRLVRRDGRFGVRTAGADGTPGDFEVLYTFGVRPLQQYLVETEPGRLQRLPWSWDARPSAEGGQRWFHLYGDEPIDADDVLHWTRPSQNWNRMCADCHSTKLVKGYDADADRYATTWSEIDVSCEACHGPASAHLAWAAETDGATDGDGRAPVALGFPVHLEGPTDGGWVRAAGASTARRVIPVGDRRDVEQCAACHAHRTPIAEREAGAAFADSYRLSLPRSPLYHVDAQVREEVFVYGSFLQSRMYREGVGCVDCHDPHTAGLRAVGNALCTRCHAADVFDGPRHHRHEQETEASACVACHMPVTTFMQVDDRRDHGFRIPRPLAADAPNACTACHTDRELPWVESTLDAWYGPPTDSTRLRVARAFAAAERDDHGVAPELARIVADTAHGAVARAVAASYLERFPSTTSLAAARAAAADPDPLVRAEGARALRMLPPNERVEPTAPLLDDPALLVRITAARTLAPVSAAALDADRRALLERANGELEHAYRLNADDPAATVERADDRAERGMLVEAERGYRRALDLEPGHVPAYLNLADLYRATSREADARSVLETGRARAPDSAVLAYALGLLHVRAERLDDAMQALEDAHTLDPSDARAPVALALALRRVGRESHAIDVLERAAPRVARPRDVLLTLVELHRERGALDRAAEHARRLRALYPADEAIAALSSELSRD